MSLLSSFVTNQLVKALEAEFIAHEPDLKDAFVNEVNNFLSTVSLWVDSKLALKSTSGAINEKSS